MAGFSIDGYIDVAERITIFRDRFPLGSLQPVNPERPFWIETIGEQTYVVYAAAAYRSANDPCPGIGVAWEPVPGKTSFTFDSEVMNAETSAWGRAIVAALAADTKKVASAEEVRNRSGDSANSPSAGEGQSRPAGPRLATDKQKRLLENLIEMHTVPDGCSWPLADDLTMRECSGYIDELKKLPKPVTERVEPMS